MKEIKLPKKLSDLILEAIKDMQAAKDAGLDIDMDTWSDVDNCSVCMTGAVMFNTLEDKKLKDFRPYNYSDYNVQRILALNDIKSGDLWYSIYFVEEAIKANEFARKFDFIDGKKVTPHRAIQFKELKELSENYAKGINEDEFINELISISGLLAVHGL